MLRQQYQTFLRRFFSREIGKYRVQCQLTQEQLSEYLCMAPRSYADLERGVSGCSCLTVVCFLLLLNNEEVLQLLDSLRKGLKEANRYAA